MPQKIFIPAAEDTSKGEKCFMETAVASWKSSYFGHIPVVQYSIRDSRVYK